MMPPEGGVNPVVDPKTVLFGQTLGYTLYCIAIILLVGWFGWRLTHAGKGRGVKPGVFYAFVALLAVLGFSLHITTSLTIPWVKPDLHRASIQADRFFPIKVADHRFELPVDRLLARVGETVRFDVVSADLTYGFGVFRPDNTMVFQMQVVPGHKNDVLWKFSEPGLYTIRSTEYSGPKGVGMVVKDAIEVLEAKKREGE
jgi:cytochrome c oxidase subunit 2